MTHSNKHNSNAVITKSCNLLSAESEGSYKLSIARQHSLEVESFVDNGKQKSVHYVIKNSAFVLEVVLRKMEKTGTLNSSVDNKHKIMLDQDLDFRKITLEAALLYDFEEDKPVMKVRSRPLSTRGLVNPATPHVCKLETTIEVLSSQHEDMNFKIKLYAVDIATNKRLEHISPVYSAPIQVISKPEVLVKKKQRTKKAPRKQTKQDQILEILGRMESKQANQQAQIDSLLASQGSINSLARAPPPRTTNYHHDSSHSNSFECAPNCSPAPSAKRNFSTFSNYEEQSPQLETAYFQFLQAYNRVKRHERPSKLRKLFASSSPTDLANFMEASSYLQSQQYHNMNTEPETPNSNSTDMSFLDNACTPSLSELFPDFQ
mmetsp:Transcript_12949/g.16202  ORF Transcript_12949/g.16202 Transcript_12949/m.16202 type:complete len:376 (-) Transcript_12949:21-1148(-)